VGNQLHFLAISQALCRKKKLFTKRGRVELAALLRGPGPSGRREELLHLLDQLDPAIDELDRAVLEEAQRREDAVRLMTHPGIGPVNALAFVLTIGPVTRSRRSKQIASYLGLHPSETLFGRKATVGSDQQTREHYGALVAVGSGASRGAFGFETSAGLSKMKCRRGNAVANAAIARKLAVRMF
jgi:transposase